MKIKITDFAKRHFSKDFVGTKILDFSANEFEEKINILSDQINRALNDEVSEIITHDGYADYCKLVAIPNFTEAKVGSLPITIENYQYLRSGYSSRRESELPVFSRWLELPLDVPKANHLILVLYSKEQIDKENKFDYEKELEEWNKTHKYESRQEGDTKPSKIDEFDADYGIVAILGQSHSDEEPMKPETMLRNALGIEEGGSGHKLNREDYLKSVDFWSKNVTIK